MNTFDFIIGNPDLILRLTWQHVCIVAVAVGCGVLVGVPTGIAITQNERAAGAVLRLAGIVMTIPSMALFGVLIQILSLINQGIGYLPAVIAIFLYSQLPIISNTYAAIRGVDPAVREAATGMGMSMRGFQRLRLVEVPIALPVIMAGIRVAVVLNIGIAAIAAYVGAGGLGFLIRAGITQTDARQVIAGAILVSLLALCADFLLLVVQRRLSPRGILSRDPA